MHNSQSNLSNLRLDIMGGLTAAIIALPLALAFGVSSGAGAAAGLYGAICVGFFAALFGGTPTQVSGPTGPMTVVMASIFTQFVAKDPDQGMYLAFSVVVLAGLLQIALGFLKLGSYITMVPFPVISGFMTGIGTIIILLQLPPLLGFPAESGVIEILLQLPEMLNAMNPIALGLGILTITVTLLYPSAVGRIIPAPLFALILGVLLYIVFLPENSVAVIGVIPVAIPRPTWPLIDLSLLWEMLGAAMVLALLGSIDSLLTSLVADTMTRTEHDSDRELIGQGIGNIVAGLIGGLPGAGATMRTVANIKAGGRTRLSGVCHSVVLMALMLGAAPLAENIPHAVLAGLLLKVGLDIIDWQTLKRLHKFPPLIAFLLLSVLLLTVFVDLVTAVACGVFLANIITVKRLADIQTSEMQVISSDEKTHQRLTPPERELMQEAEGKILVLHFNGPISYAAAKTIYSKVQRIPSHQAIILDFSDVPFIDITTAMTIGHLLENAEKMGRYAFVAGINDTVEHILSTAGVSDLITSHSRHSARSEAIHCAFNRINRIPG